MARTNRDEFLRPTIRACGERVQYFCTNPSCRNATIIPHSTEDKSVTTGKACHINAAAPGGPRYDPNQTPEQRSSAENAIWLCSNCSDMVDKDEARFPADLLREWKVSLEAWLRDGGVIPRLPELSLTTTKGFFVPEEPGTIDVSDQSQFREHVFAIQNVADTELRTIHARFQSPEPIYQSDVRSRPAGVNVEWRPERVHMIAGGSTGARITRQRGPLQSNIYEFQVDRLPARQRIEIAFTTSRKVWEEHDISFDTGLWKGMNDPPSRMYYFDGTYQFELRNMTVTKQLFAPIEYSLESRQMSFIEVIPDHGLWRVGKFTFFS